MDFVAFADLRPASQIRMRHDSRATLYPDRAFDDDVRANLDFGVDFRLGIDHGRRMNAHENDNSPSPSLFPTPRGYRLKTDIRNPNRDCFSFSSLIISICFELRASYFDVQSCRSDPFTLLRTCLALLRESQFYRTS